MSVKHFLNLEGKRYIKALPTLITGAIALFILIGAIAFCATRFFDQKNNAAVAKVGIVTDSVYAQKYSLLLANNYEASTNNFNFITFDTLDEARYQLNEGNLTALITLPPGIMDNIKNGTDYQAAIYLGQVSGFSNLLVKEFAKAGSSLLMTAQACIYSIADLYFLHGLYEYTDEAFTNINLTNLRYALSSDSLFSVKKLTVSDTHSPYEFYITAGYILLLSLWGICFSGYLNTNTPSFNAKLKMINKGLIKLKSARYTYVFISYFIFCFITYPLISHMVLKSKKIEFLPVLVLSLSFSILVYLLFSLTKNSMHSIILLFILSFILAFLSGFIIPNAFLGTFIRKLSSFSPFTLLQNMMLTN